MGICPPNQHCLQRQSKPKEPYRRAYPWLPGGEVMDIGREDE